MVMNNFKVMFNKFVKYFDNDILFKVLVDDCV